LSVDSIHPFSPHRGEKIMSSLEGEKNIENSLSLEGEG
jgi:hypothetical protein